MESTNIPEGLRHFRCSDHRDELQQTRRHTLGHFLKTRKFSVLTIACTPTGVSPLPCSNKYSLLETATLKNKFTGHGSYPQLLGTFSFVNLIFF